MIIVFPVSCVDVHLALPLARWMLSLGPYPRHDCLIVWSSELTADKREPIAVEFRQMGWKTPAKATTAAVSVQEWPSASNEIFWHSAMMVSADPSLQRPWFFMEADCVPMRAGWADELADEYNRDLEKPFLGCIDTTYSRNSDGSLFATGKHLVGTAVYPANLLQTARHHPVESDAFDIFLARDIMPNARHTALIQHNWSTGNYRRENGKIICDTVELRFTQKGNALNREIDPRTAVLHGCKDGSLLALLANPSVQTVPTLELQVSTNEPKKKRRQRTTA